MATSQVIRKLELRRNAWLKERRGNLAPGRPDFLNGVLRGLAEAVSIARECHKFSMDFKRLRRQR